MTFSHEQTMSTALVLPRFSELFKELYIDHHENLNLAPLRTFPESFSREFPPPLQQQKPHDTLDCRSGHNLVIHTFTDNMDSEASSSTDAHSSTSHGSCSRSASPSDEMMDYDVESEGVQPQSPLEMILFRSPGEKGKSSAPQKPKKVKYHFCEICQKPFPRPSGLRAHMNMHTKDKPFECGFPGCPKRFSVSSNAKRHLRTHGVGLSPSDEPTPLPYVVDFEEPVVVNMDCGDTSGSTPEPLSLRWMPLGAGSRRSHKMQNRTELS